jgi:hypothetical protein
VTIQAFLHEEVVKVGQDTLRLVLNFRALDAIESETQRPFDTILGQLTTRGAVPPTSLVSRVVWGLLRQHHADVDIDQAAGLVNGPDAPAIGVAMGKLFETAFPRAQPVDPKAKPANPRKPRGASKPSSSRGAPRT